MKTNLLSKESSPYLLQHMHNPVDWYPWGEDAFNRARVEDKPIFLSIGYATCYWCHVMEKDSFERDEVANVLNERFISIKVDREERPDIDQIYMDAVVGLTGQGGWPMSVFLTPDRKPFWGGTYFPRDRFIEILNMLSEAWKIEREGVLNSASNITKALKERKIEGESGDLNLSIINNAGSAFKRSYDSRYGGFGNAPKFPPSQQIRLLFRIYDRSKDDEILDIAKNTLLNMAHGGIFDHLEGGFHRYATDAAWVIPHFEKMLYDNALLIPAYLDAYQITGENSFAQIAQDTLAYLLNRMRSDEGGFFSAEDAGEVSKEGEFYVWSHEDLTSILTNSEIEALSTSFNISKDGNFEGQNIFTLKSGLEWEVKSKDPLKSILTTLKISRDKRDRPLLDDKILTSWNGLVLSALSQAAVVLGDDEYLRAATNLAAFIKGSLIKDGRLQHRYRMGVTGIDAFLEDYSYLIEGLCGLYRATFNETYLEWANALQQEQDQYLWDNEHGIYDFSSASDVLYRRKDVIDGATPSGNSVSISNLLYLSEAFGILEYRNKAQKIFAYLSSGFKSYPSAFAKAIQSLDQFLSTQRELVVIGADDSWRDKIKSIYTPNLRVFFSTTPKSSKLPIVNVRTSRQAETLFYLCESQTCKEPTAEFDKILSAIVDN